MMFMWIGCGGMRGFDGREWGLMGGWIRNEKEWGGILYGGMVREGIVGVMWGGGGSYLFEEKGIVDKVSGVGYCGGKVGRDI